jgi:hypothetical protein
MVIEKQDREFLPASNHSVPLRNSRPDAGADSSRGPVSFYHSDDRFSNDLDIVP